MAGLAWRGASAGETAAPAPPRRTLVVKPIFTYPLPQRAPQTSWRNWGGLETENDAREELARIEGELNTLQAKADFPLRFLPVAKVRGAEAIKSLPDLGEADAILFYSAGDGAGDFMGEVNTVDRLGKDVIFFVRHQSGPLYYWYEGASARYLRQHTDVQAEQAVRCEDTVVDSLDEVLWRLRALAGLRATVGSRILAIGGPA